MIAIRLPNAATAQAVSRGLWLLCRPESVGMDEGTLYLASWEAQGDGTALLIVDPAWTLPIHGDVMVQIADAADAMGSRAKLAALLGPLLTNSATGLPAARALIARGGAMRIGDILPLINPTMWVPYVAPVRTGP